MDKAIDRAIDLLDKENKEKENKEPPKKRLRLSLKPKERFPLVPAEDIAKSTKELVPSNTAKSNQWALRCFDQWLEQRNERSEEKCPVDILITDDMEKLCHWMVICVNEIRKANGEDYTPRSISQFISGIQRYISSKKEHPIRLADPNNPIFRPLHRALDSRFRELHAKGVGTTRRQAEVVTCDEEEILWSSGELSTDSPDGLLKAVFYYNGLNFVLRGGQEHRNLKVSQFNIRNVPDPDNPGERITCCEYSEHGSKNHPGGRHQE